MACSLKNGHCPIVILFSNVMYIVWKQKRAIRKKKFEYFFFGSKHPYHKQKYVCDRFYVVVSFFLPSTLMF